MGVGAGLRAAVTGSDSVPRGKLLLPGAALGAGSHVQSPRLSEDLAGADVPSAHECEDTGLVTSVRWPSVLGPAVWGVPWGEEARSPISVSEPKRQGCWRGWGNGCRLNWPVGTTHGRHGQLRPVGTTHGRRGQLRPVGTTHGRRGQRRPCGETGRQRALRGPGGTHSGPRLGTGCFQLQRREWLTLEARRALRGGREQVSLCPHSRLPHLS